MSEEAEILVHASRRVGTVLHGKYHIDGVLGVGGMATVYAATHRNRKRFAVKMLHTEFSVRSDVRARFVREGYVANTVPHAGVVAVLDDDVDETGSAFLVMELLEGVTVDALYTSGGPLPVREALAIAYQLLDVLDAAHQKSVVHRDIKPANLFVLRDGQVKVLDFGIARLRDNDAGLKSTRNGSVLGTPAFMAPEQALAMPENVDARTDVWAAGATLFTMLTACFVHPGQNARQIMIRAATDPARSIQSVMPELPPSVAAIVSRALAFDRSQRWPSAAAMRDAVHETFCELFGSAPVQADVGALVERTSAVIGSQPTQLQPLTDLQRPVLGVRSTPSPLDVTVDAVARPRALETTMSTPVVAQGQGAGKARWAPVAVLAGTAFVAIAVVLVLTRPTARTRSPIRGAVASAASVARADATPSTPSSRAEATVPAVREAAVPPESSPRPPKPATSPGSARKPSRAAASAIAAAPNVPNPAPPDRPENPLTLKLQ